MSPSLLTAKGCIVTSQRVFIASVLSAALLSGCSSTGAGTVPASPTQNGPLTQSTVAKPSLAPNLVRKPVVHPAFKGVAQCGVESESWTNDNLLYSVTPPPDFIVATDSNPIGNPAPSVTLNLTLQVTQLGYPGGPNPGYSLEVIPNVYDVNGNNITPGYPVQYYWAWNGITQSVFTTREMLAVPECSVGYMTLDYQESNAYTESGQTETLVYELPPSNPTPVPTPTIKPCPKCLVEVRATPMP